MAKIAYILLCHKDPDGVIERTRALISAGDCVAIHFDRRASPDAFSKLQAEFKGDPSVAFAPRVQCGWGEWSLVQATLNALQTARTSFQDATHFYLVSGDCMPIKSAEYCHAVLDAEDRDHIESVDFFTSGWIKTGFVEERLIYRHIFNERNQKRLYYASIKLQRWFGLRRKLPTDLQIRIGSQWWCLRKSTVDAVLAFVSKRRDIVRFFKRSWIPDETFFQTLVYHLVPRIDVNSESPTFLMFSDYGMPVNFYNDHYDLLLGQRHLFARKISPEADELKARLSALYREPRQDFTITNEGRRLHAYVTGKGRVGRRFSPRFWERDTSLGSDRQLLIVTCKKWHVARRLIDRVSLSSNLPATDFIFDEEQTPLPDLGGIENSLTKRTRHRRALVGMLFDHFETERLILCLDPSNVELIRDFYGDRCDTRLLEIDCSFSDEYLTGHALRVGLMSEATPPGIVAGLLKTVRNDVTGETAALRDARFPEVFRLREHGTDDENARALAGFLSMSEDAARQVIQADTLFAD
jgi:hypothetical protein